jgi:signal transduction histidine kinase
MTGDAEKLKQVFINIISNGCQAMDDGGILNVDIQPNSEHVDIAVSDTGTGIHSDDISPMIFLKYLIPLLPPRRWGSGWGLQ